MYKNIKKAIIALAAVLMMISGATIVESAELNQAGGYVEIVPFVSSCAWRVNVGTATAFTSSTNNTSAGAFHSGTIVHCDLQVGGTRRRVSGPNAAGRIINGWVNTGNLVLVSCR